MVANGRAAFRALIQLSVVSNTTSYQNGVGIDEAWDQYQQARHCTRQDGRNTELEERRPRSLLEAQRRPQWRQRGGELHGLSEQVDTTSTTMCS